MKLIFALGNPGKQYEKTRHNAGWIALDILLEEFGYDKVQLDKDAHIYTSKINGEKVMFIKPQTFMNNSGDIVRKMFDFYKVGIEDILIMHDEKDFTINKNQLKFGGSSAGHNGIKSIINKMSTQDFLRYRIGIDPPLENWLIVDWVLSKFSEDNINDIKKSTKINSQYIKEWIAGKKITTKNI
ncbi:peptidyl-tRNA hydrolase [Entomoplasma ellychniae]|uniref:Peptidyl-tRNA hydrolase n=1 Tax=Entomoplasma ellychniae TaxID=2114 RepID=A0A8E2UA67_9MOLU|nr:aminoacyl-tRNA hydrolase [Entomoplasma ellychniae]PPE04859.1 peptidyl-tRNA hydrolase [Entomoplasma ellychniae]